MHQWRLRFCVFVCVSALEKENGSSYYNQKGLWYTYSLWQDLGMH